MFSGPGSPITVVQKGSSLGDRGVGLEDLLGGVSTAVLRPEPLHVAGEPLVEPDVLPGLERQVVADPLVGELVHDHRRVVAGLAEPALGVDRSGLVLQGEADARVVVDDAAGLPERVAAEDVVEEVDDLRLPGQRRLGVFTGRGTGRLAGRTPVAGVARAAGRRPGARSSRPAGSRRPRRTSCPRHPARSRRRRRPR